MDIKQITEKVEKALDKVRPYLQADGGDVKLLEITEDLSVKIEMTGACDGCPYSMHTLKAGVEMGIMKDVPEIKEVIAVNIKA